MPGSLGVPPPAGGWEFDAVARRKRRQAALEKAESERKAKRQKQSQVRPGDQGRRRSAEEERREKEKAARRGRSPPHSTSGGGAPERSRSPPPSTTGSAPPAATPPAAGGDTLGTAGQNPAPSAQENQAEALKSFLKDHPEFMRVLSNPKKSLSDPRVKAMFVKELSNYPAVKTFLESKGLSLSMA